ncbi:MAG: ring-cleaving dioxygenase [Gammaproteobacteria bacterium]|nr:ring-cleaving dioxygenase [Gammaproteobacteria bacterium]
MTYAQGLHHVTAVAADPQRNVDFYTRVLGLRLVKKTVNQDDPFTYHLYYGDALGRPGTAMTFFPFPGVPAGQPGRGQPIETQFSVPLNTLTEWESRLRAAAVEISAGPSNGQADRLQFTDPDGLPLALIAEAPEAGDLESEPAIRGFAGLTLASHRPDSTARMLTELLGYAPVTSSGATLRFKSQGSVRADHIELIESPMMGRPGYGTVHHIAFRVPNRSALLEMLERVQAARLPCSGEVDRFYFRSVYFREPGGMLFEIATDDPGFTVDEPVESLGQTLKLTAEHEPMRAAIETSLPALEYF